MDWTRSNWLDTDNWSGLSAATNFGDNGGTKGYGTPQNITAPHTLNVGDFGSAGRGSRGWALKFPSVVTVKVKALDAYGATVTIKTTQDLDTTYLNAVNVPYDGSEVEVTGQVIWYTFDTAADLAGLGELDADTVLTFYHQTASTVSRWHGGAR